MANGKTALEVASAVIGAAGDLCQDVVKFLAKVDEATKDSPSDSSKSTAQLTGDTKQ